jgi:hypothetical protein
MYGKKISNGMNKDYMRAYILWNSPAGKFSGIFKKIG